MVIRISAATGCLLLLWAAVAAQQLQTPPAQPSTGQSPSQQPVIAPLQQANPPYQPGAPTVNRTPSLVQPPPSQPVLAQPGTVQPVPAQPQVQPVPPAAVVTTPAPVTTLLIPAPSAPKDPPLGSEQLNKIRGNEQHYREESAVAKSDFDLRQAEEKKRFEATLAGKGFWERGRLKRQFRAAQAQRRKEFDAEQEKKRQTYEWRYH